MQAEPGYVVTLDQRSSRSGPDRVPELLEALAAVPTVAAFERTAGDEVQGLFADPAGVREALLTALRADGWHCGVGVGPVEPGSHHQGTRAGRGPAYVAAREAVEAAKELETHVAIRGAGAAAEPAAADCQAVWQLVAALVLGRTAAQWRVVDMVDRCRTQAEAADRLGMQPGSVTGALRLSRIREQRAAHPALDHLADRVRFAAGRGADA